MEGEADWRRTWPAQPFLTPNLISAAAPGAILYAHNQGAICYHNLRDEP
jgi:hypothetical protein